MQAKENIIKRFYVKGDELFRGSLPITEPSMMILCKKDGCFAYQIGSRKHVENAYMRHVASNSKYVKHLICITFNENLPVNFICSIFNAHVNNISCRRICEAMLHENPKRLAKQLVKLQNAGY